MPGTRTSRLSRSSSRLKRPKRPTRRRRLPSLPRSLRGVGETVTFDAGDSADDNEIVEYQWEIDGALVDASGEDARRELPGARRPHRDGDGRGRHRTERLGVGDRDCRKYSTRGRTRKTIPTNPTTLTIRTTATRTIRTTSPATTTLTLEQRRRQRRFGRRQFEQRQSEQRSPSSGGSSGGAALPADESATASISQTDDGRLVVTVENAAAGRAVSADVPGDANATGLRSVRLVPATDADELNITLFPSDDVSAPTGTDAGLYEVRTGNGTDVAGVTYRFAVDRAIGESGRTQGPWRVTAQGVDHRPHRRRERVDDGLQATTTDVRRVVVAAVAPDVSATAIGTDGTATVGEPATVEATLANDGHLDANQTVNLTVDGAVVDSRNVTVRAGETANVSFETTFDTPGNVRVSVAGTEERSPSRRPTAAPTLKATRSPGATPRFVHRHREHGRRTDQWPEHGAGPRRPRHPGDQGCRTHPHAVVAHVRSFSSRISFRLYAEVVRSPRPVFGSVRLL